MDKTYTCPFVALVTQDGVAAGVSINLLAVSTLLNEQPSIKRTRDPAGLHTIDRLVVGRWECPAWFLLGTCH